MTPPHYRSDYDLVSRVLDGEKSAWDALFSETLQPYINGMAAKAFLPKYPDLFEEAVLEAVYQIYANLGQYRGEAKITTWAYFYVLQAISKNWRDLGIGRKAEEIDEGRLVTLGAFRQGPDQDLEGRILLMKVKEVLRDMNPVYQNAIELHIIQGLSVPDIAARENVSENTVKSWLKRAIRKLKDHFADQERHHG